MKAIFKGVTFFLMLFISLYDLTAADAKNRILSADPSLGRTSPVYANAVIVRFKASYYNSGKFEKTLSATGSILGKPLFPKNLSISNNKHAKQNTLLSSGQVERIKKAEEPLLRTYIVEYKGSMPPEKYCKYLLKTNPSVEIAEPLVADQMLNVTNDPLLSQQTLLYTIQAFQAWDICPGDTNVVIGISDNGVNQEHEDLANSIAPNWAEIPENGIDDDGNGYIDDYIGCNLAYNDDHTDPGVTYHSMDHGTYVAGIAGATLNNGLGMAGVGGLCRIFPIKIAEINDSNLPYAYQSIIYAGVRGLKVLNCSWGAAKTFSQIDQSVIDYAVSRDVAIVVSSGNYKYSIYEDWYPAGYFGVLGIGEVNQSDRITSSTTLGWQVGVMAPGIGDVGTTLPNGYETNDHAGGTSWASPVVAGVVAIIRARFPQLTAMQALELARQSIDDISSKNTDYIDLVKGRINMLKAVSTDPMSIPGIRPLSFKTSSTDGLSTDRFNPGEEGLLSIRAHNYLGAASSLSFTLSMANDMGESVSILDSIVNISSVPGGQDLDIATFRFRINSQNYARVFFRIDIKGENNYHDFFLLPFQPTSNITTFENDVIKFSVADRGTFGFTGGDIKIGSGFLFKNKGGNLLWEGGIMVTENRQKVESSVYGMGSESNDFTIVKPFTNPDKNTGVISDADVWQQKRIGVNVEQTYRVRQGDSPLAKVDVKITNTSGKTLNNIAAGYFFDWDLGPNEDSNTVRLCEECYPAASGLQATAEIAEYTGGGYPAVVCAVFTYDMRGIPQATGLDYNYINDLTDDKHIAMLNTGTALQHDRITDINFAVGMQFTGEFEPGGERRFTMVFGTSVDKETLANKVKEEILTSVDDNPVDGSEQTITISPQPASGYISLRLAASGESHVSIYDMIGVEVLPSQVFQGENALLDISALSSGSYILQIRNGSEIYAKPFVVIK